MLSYFADFLLPGLLNKPTLSTWLATQLDALMANLLVDASSLGCLHKSKWENPLW